MWSHSYSQVCDSTYMVRNWENECWPRVQTQWTHHVVDFRQNCACYLAPIGSHLLKRERRRGRQCFGALVLMPIHILFAVVLEMFVYKEIEGAMEGWESCQTGLKWVKELDGDKAICDLEPKVVSWVPCLFPRSDWPWHSYTLSHLTIPHHLFRDSISLLYYNSLE